MWTVPAYAFSLMVTYPLKPEQGSLTNKPIIEFAPALILRKRLISHSKNSRLSNFQPKNKQEHFAISIEKRQIDSLKLYAMLKWLKDKDNWWADEIEEHEEYMLSVLLKKDYSHPCL